MRNAREIALGVVLLPVVIVLWVVNLVLVLGARLLGVVPERR